MAILTRADIDVGYPNRIVWGYRTISFLGLPNLEDAQEVSLESMYVGVRLSRELTAKTSVRLAQALKENRQLVILGEPGAGKSTLLQLIAYSFALERSPLRHSLGNFVPVFIKLREFDVAKWNTPIDMLKDYITTLDPELRNAPEPISVEWFLDQFRGNKAALLIDGLDEVGNTTTRRKLRDAVIAPLIAEFPGNYFLLTSRMIGYDEVRFDTPETTIPGFDLNDMPPVPFEKMRRMYLAPFDEEQIKDYINRWYTVRESNQTKRWGDVDVVLKAILGNRKARALAERPALLAMICLIHRVAGAIPVDVLKLYDKIVEAYLETIPTFRNLPRPVFSLEEMKRWLSYAAFQMQGRHASEDGQTTVPPKDFLGYLETASRDRAIADQFYEYLIQRSGLLLPIGPEAVGFSHLSFQEYFAAWWLRGKIRRFDELVEECLKHVAESQWDETIFLLCRMLVEFPGALEDFTTALRHRHETPEIAFEQAKALYDATVDEPDSRECEALANQIGELRQRHETPEIALMQALALKNVTVVARDPRQCEALARQIGDLRKRHNTPEIALAQAKALFNGTVGETDPRQREALAIQIGDLRKQHDTPEIALAQARALFNSIAGEPDPWRSLARAQEIAELRNRHDTPEIALAEAKSLAQATIGERDPRRCEELAVQIAELRYRHDTPEIAMAQAQSIVNATAVQPDPRRREALASQIAELRQRHDTPEIALAQAEALFNATVIEPDPRSHESLANQLAEVRRREALANQIAELRQRHNTPEIALAQAQTLLNVAVVEPDPSRREALTSQIAELRQRHDTPEIALAQAQTLLNATLVEPDPHRREALAQLIGELRRRHDTPEIARWQAQALFNATVDELDPRRREALANQIAELRQRHDTPEIALWQAKALHNATAVEPDPYRRETLANQIAELQQRQATSESAPQQQRDAQAQQIGELQKRDEVSEIALAEAEALYYAPVVEPDPRQREAQAHQIKALRKRPSEGLGKTGVANLFMRVLVWESLEKGEAVAVRDFVFEAWLRGDLKDHPELPAFYQQYVEEFEIWAKDHTSLSLQISTAMMKVGNTTTDAPAKREIWLRGLSKLELALNDPRWPDSEGKARLLQGAIDLLERNYTASPQRDHLLAVFKKELERLRSAGY